MMGKKDPKEQVNQWTKQIRSEQRQLTRQIREIERGEAKVKTQIKQSAKKNQMDVCKILAKELVQSRRAVTKLHVMNAEMNSLTMKMKEQLAQVRMTGALSKSTAVMSSVNKLMNVPDMQKTMMELSKEMQKAGVIEEIMNDTMDSVFDEDGLQEAADEEVENVLFELTAGQLGKAPVAKNQKLPQVQQPAQEISLDDDEVEARLAGLKN